MWQRQYRQMITVTTVWLFVGWGFGYDERHVIWIWILTPISIEWMNSNIKISSVKNRFHKIWTHNNRPMVGRGSHPLCIAFAPKYYRIPGGGGCATHTHTIGRTSVGVCLSISLHDNLHSFITKQFVCADLLRIYRHLYCWAFSNGTGRASVCVCVHAIKQCC